jgi:hypothetical protein
MTKDTASEIYNHPCDMPVTGKYVSQICPMKIIDFINISIKKIRVRK